MDDWFQMDKDYAKAEKELKIENWVQISICYGHGHQSVTLYTYDLPREVYERRMWVIRWRVARPPIREQISGYSEKNRASVLG